MSEEVKDTYIKLRVTKQEKENLKYYSEAIGLPISQLIRERCKEILERDAETDEELLH
jgi:antitoxin component of RelBE/YafQ-DinJ toxin-antitoxin module